MSGLRKELSAGLGSGQEPNSSTTHLAPSSYFDLEKTPGSPDSEDHEYNPSLNAKPCSPFYNHDVPRPSSERPKNSVSPSRVHVIQVSTNDEAEDKSPSVARPSIDVERGEAEKSADGMVKLGPGRFNNVLRLQRQPQKKSMIRPRRKGCTCLAGLTKGQRLAVKLLIAILIVGAMIAVGVGISIKVGGGVYKNSNQTTKIGRRLLS